MNDAWEYGWTTSNGGIKPSDTRGEAEGAVEAWNDRARHLRAEANGRASYPSAWVIRRRPAVAAGAWEQIKE